ncbi:MAG: hypothetical protein LBJ42_00200 [Holosporales bacterium]|nr:hypothetical protein [Holosporales bacterium]
MAGKVGNKESTVNGVPAVVMKRFSQSLEGKWRDTCGDDPFSSAIRFLRQGGCVNPRRRVASLRHGSAAVDGRG